MGRVPSRQVIESFGAFLRRSTPLSDGEIRGRLDDLASGRLRQPDPVAERPRPATPSRVEASPIAPSPIPIESVRAAPGAGGGTPYSEARLAELRARHAPARLPIRFPEHALAADEAPPEDVLARLARLVDRVVAQFQGGEVPSVDLPDLHRANALYDERGNVFVGPNVRRMALDGRSGEAFIRLLSTVEMAAENLRTAGITTKRGLYYHHGHTIADARGGQTDSDRALAGLANLLRVRRRALGFVEARRGLIWGDLVVRDGSATIDLARLGTAGRAIPRFTDDMEILSSDAELVLVVEKHAVAARLAEARIWETARCILVCSEGSPSVSTRELVRQLVDRFALPAMICADADVGGVRIALTFAHGSISTALETPWLACNDTWWVGLHPSDIGRRFGINTQIRLTEADVEAARQLRDHPSDAYVNRRVRDELATLVDRRAKVEIDVLVHDVPRFVDEYLPEQLFESEPVKL